MGREESDDSQQIIDSGEGQVKVNNLYTFAIEKMAQRKRTMFNLKHINSYMF
jgi:hypothetical protein